MDKEKLVVDLETARKLKEAGWDKVTVFKYYVENIYHNTWTLGLNMVDSHSVAKIKIHEMLEDLPAPTLQEIWNAIPSVIWRNMEHAQFMLFASEIHLRGVATEHVMEYFDNHDNPSDNAAEAWLWCKENKYL